MYLCLYIHIYIYTCVYIYIYFFFRWTKLNRLSILPTQLPGHRVGVGFSMRKSSFTIRTNSFLETSKVANDFVQQICFTPCSRVIFVQSPSLFWLVKYFEPKHGVLDHRDASKGFQFSIAWANGKLPRHGGCEFPKKQAIKKGTRMFKCMVNEH